MATASTKAQTKALKSKAPLEERQLRADARRNHDRVLKAARWCFAANGLQAQMDDIATRAGVGVGTVYRHFPTKEALVEALAADHFRHLAESARAALDVSDPWEGFSGFMYRAAELQAKDLAMAEVMAAQPGLVRMAVTNRADLHADLHEAVAELVARAQKAGKLRKDVVPDDVPMLMCGLGRMTRVDSKASASSWQRYVAIVLDGLRSPGSSPLPRGGGPN